MERNKTKVVNLTPHEITIMDNEGRVIKRFPSDGIARLSTRTVHCKPFVMDDRVIIPSSKTVFGEVENLPDPEEGTIYIVSNLIAQANPDRRDLVIPNESVRDEKGRIIGCRSLGRI